MMHLATTCEAPERPADFDLALRIVRDVLRVEWHAYFLWTDGQYVHANVDDIMRRANQRRKRLGQPQFTGKREWVV